MYKKYIKLALYLLKLILQWYHLIKSKPKYSNRIYQI